MNAGDEINQGALSGSTGSDQREALAGLDGELREVQREGVAVMEANLASDDEGPGVHGGSLLGRAAGASLSTRRCSMGSIPVIRQPAATVATVYRARYSLMREWECPQ